MAQYTIIPGHGKVKIGSEYWTTRPGIGKCKAIATGPVVCTTHEKVEENKNGKKN